MIPTADHRVDELMVAEGFGGVDELEGAVDRPVEVVAAPAGGS